MKPAQETARAPGPVWDSRDLITVIYFSSSAGGRGSPQEGVGIRFQLPLLGQVQEEQVSVALPLKASGKDGGSLAPAAPGSLACEKLWHKGQPWNQEGHVLPCPALLSSHPSPPCSLRRARSSWVEVLRGFL